MPRHKRYPNGPPVPTDQRHYASATLAEKRGVIVTIAERRERLDTIERMLIAGISMSRIEDVAKEKLGMSFGRTRSYIDRIRAMWAEEERAGRPHNKAAAIRRCLGHVAEARRDKNWSAVAQFEKHLSDLQGTKEPVEVNLNIDATVTEAALHVVASLTPERRAALIAQQRQLLALASKVAIDTTGVEMPADTEPRKS